MQRITVITPSYYQAQYLDETIRSVLNQGYDDLEYMVVDGGSTDGSVDIIRRYADQLAYWTSEPDRGQAHAINKGLERSTGEIIGWLNSDDVLLPGALQRIADAHQSPQVHVTCGMREVVDWRGTHLDDWGLIYPAEHTLRRACIVWQETVYWDREVLERVGGLDESLQFAMDYDYWQRVLDAGFEFTPLPYFIGAYRIHDATKNTTMQAVREQELRTIYRRYLGRNVSESELEEEWTVLWRLQRKLVQKAASSGWLRRVPVAKALAAAGKFAS